MEQVAELKANKENGRLQKEEVETQIANMATESEELQQIEASVRAWNRRVLDPEMEWDEAAKRRVIEDIVDEIKAYPNPNGRPRVVYTFRFSPLGEGTGTREEGLTFRSSSGREKGGFSLEVTGRAA